MLSQNNTSFDFPLFSVDVRVLRMSYSMTLTKIEFDLAPYLEMIISGILVMRQIFKLLSQKWTIWSLTAVLSLWHILTKNKIIRIEL